MGKRREGEKERCGKGKGEEERREEEGGREGPRKGKV